MITDAWTLAHAAARYGEQIDRETERETAAAPAPGPRIVRPRIYGAAAGPTWGLSLASGIALLALWWLVTALSLVSPLFLPAPAAVWQQAGAVIAHGYAGASFAEHLAASLGRVLLAAAIAIAVAVPLGLLMGLSRTAKGVFDTPLEFYWPLPPLSYLPLMIIWLGIGEASKVTLLVLAMAAPICLATQAGVRALPAERVNGALTLGASRRQIVTDIVLPSALPDILTGIRIALGVGWSTLVAAELIAATRGIGFMTLSAAHFLETDVVFVGIASIALSAFAFSFVMRALEARLVPWRARQ